METITSKDNKHIKDFVKLCASSKERRERNLFVLEGVRLCEEAAKSGLLVEVLFTKTAFEKYNVVSEIIEASEKAFEISESVASKLADTQSSQGVFGVCRIPERANKINEMKRDGKYLLLENIQDPSNLGAICRIVDALGLDGIIIEKGGCDIYNPKAQRAAMGSLLRVEIFEIDNAVEFINKKKEEGILTIASTPRDKAEAITDIDFSKGAVCVIGNEGNGVTPELMSACEKIMTIPMSGKAESLNVSTAAAIISWEMIRK